MLPTTPGPFAPAGAPAAAPAPQQNPQALPYSAYPAPQVSMASAAQPARLMAPIQQTQAQIGDALAAARGPQPAPQLAVQPPSMGPGGMTPAGGALSMGQQAMQPPQGPTRHSPPMPAGAPQQPMMPPQMHGGVGPMAQGDPVQFSPQQMQEAMMNAMGRGGPRFWGGFNWGAQQGDPNYGRTPFPINEGPARFAPPPQGVDRSAMRPRGYMDEPMDGAVDRFSGGWR